MFKKLIVLAFLAVLFYAIWVVLSPFALGVVLIGSVLAILLGMGLVCLWLYLLVKWLNLEV